MKYYVVSDTHGFYTETEAVLQEKGFFDETEPCKLIICGDLLDRGKEALKMQSFAVDLLEKDKLIFIRGNHEDLMLDMISDFYSIKDSLAWGFSHHITNGTYSSALQLTGCDDWGVFKNSSQFLYKLEHTPFVAKLIPSALNYYETEHYVFVHGWIPCRAEKRRSSNHVKKMNIEGWRECNSSEWEQARWVNGMEMAGIYKAVEEDKTIVCGHWHSSWGHAKLEKRGTEFGSDADFSPYCGRGIIAVDACTAYTGKVNCVVLED